MGRTCIIAALWHQVLSSCPDGILRRSDRLLRCVSCCLLFEILLESSAESSSLNGHQACSIASHTQLSLVCK